MPYNTPMSYLQIILPFALAPESLAKDLASQIKVPALASLLGYAKRTDFSTFDEFARLLPHEYCFAEDLCLKHGVHQAHRVFENSHKTLQPIDNERHNSPAATHNLMHTLGCLHIEGFWFTLSPVHIHVARDHLVLTDQRRLAITEAESRALFASAKSMCDELGHTLVFGDSNHWFLRADAWRELRTSTLDAACGHHLDIWMAQGEYAGAWRKLQNEIQMLWHIHPVNSEREARGESTINSVWLHSGSDKITAAPQLLKGSQSWEDLMALAQSSAGDAPTMHLFLDDLIEPAINNDWGMWLERMHALDTQWFTPLLSAMHDKQDKRIKKIHFILSDAQHQVQYQIQTSNWWNNVLKIWQKPSLSPLFLTTNQ